MSEELANELKETRIGADVSPICLQEWGGGGVGLGGARESTLHQYFIPCSCANRLFVHPFILDPFSQAHAERVRYVG